EDDEDRKRLPYLDNVYMTWYEWQYAWQHSDMQRRKGKENAMQSEDALRAGALACFTNAQELYEEAKLLYEHNSPRSIVLALIGQEEFAKAVVYTVAALLPQQHHHLSDKLGGHELKHHICGLADGLVCMYEEGWVIEGTPPIDRLGD